MVSHSEDFIQRAEALAALNERPVIQGLRSPIVRVRWSAEGLTRRWWLHFENGCAAYIPTTKTLRSVAEMEILLSDVLGISVTLQTGKYKRAWIEVECDLIMQAAENHQNAGGGVTDQLLELLSNTYLIYGTEDSNGDPISGSHAATVFAEQSTKEITERRYIAVQAEKGLYVHLAAISKIWNSIYSVPPTRDALCSALHQEGFIPVAPHPVQHAGSHGGGGKYAASVRMWLKAEGFLND